MTFELTATPEALLAERDRLDDLLQTSEDWRALVQLQARGTRGERLSAIDACGLEALLRGALAENPFYLRRCAVENELTRRSTLTDAVPPAVTENAGSSGPPHDDLTRIRGVDADLAAKLRGLNVSAFAQIVGWTAAEVRLVSEKLGLGRQISAQNWIEQAAMLARHKLDNSFAHSAPSAAASAAKTAAGLSLTASAREPTPHAALDHPASLMPPLPLPPLAYALTQEEPDADEPPPRPFPVASIAATLPPAEQAQNTEPSPAAPTETLIEAPAPPPDEPAPRTDAAQWASDTVREALAIQPLAALQAVEDATEELLARAGIAEPPKVSHLEQARAAVKHHAEQADSHDQPGIIPDRRLTLRRGIEEASVEIVRSPVPEPPPSPAKALRPVAEPAGRNQRVQPAPGPIGRFLKALTGN